MENQSSSSKKPHIAVSKLSTLSMFNPLNSTFNTRAQTSQRNQTPTANFSSHKRALSSMHLLKGQPLTFRNFKEKSAISTSINFFSCKAEKSRPISSIIPSFHADKTQQDFLKNQNDPIFRDFNNLLKKNKGSNIIGPFEEILRDFRVNRQKKQREMIFYLRKMNYSKVLMKDLVNEFKKHDECSIIEEKEIYLNHIRENWGDSVKTFTNVSNMLENLMMNAGDRDAINRILSSLIQESQNLRVYQLNLLCILFYAKCSIITKDFYKAIALFKQAKFIAHTYSNMKIKLKCYKGLGICCQILKKYALAKHYFIKVLQFSWLVNDKQNELLAYDSIGLQYYYLGDIEQAQYFHFKMMKGEYEKESSALRGLGINKLEIYKERKMKNKQLKKEASGNEIPENPLLYISSSDEEFEFMGPKDQMKKMKMNEYRRDKGTYSKAEEFRLNPNKSIFMRGQIVKTANNNIRYKSMMEFELNKIKKIDQMKTQKHMVSAKFLLNNPNLNSKIVLSHLTPNKSANFFHNNLFKGNEMKGDENANQVFNKLDGRSLKKIVKKTKYFNANIHFTIKHVEAILKCVGLPNSS